MQYALVQWHIDLVSHYVVQSLEVFGLELLTFQFSVNELRCHIVHHNELAHGLVEFYV